MTVRNVGGGAQSPPPSNPPPGGHFQHHLKTYVLLLVAIILTVGIASCVSLARSASNAANNPCDGLLVSGYGWNSQTQQWVKC